MARPVAGESGSCGAPRLCLHRAIRLSSGLAAQKGGFCLITRENVTSADWPVAPRGMPYYCIARGGELWFERLDFGVLAIWPRYFQEYVPRPFVRGRIVQHFRQSGGCFGVLSRERERHEDVEGPDRPAVAGSGGGRRGAGSRR